MTVTPRWTFDEKWNPIDSSEIQVARMEYADSSLFLFFDELVMNIGNVIIKTESGKTLNYKAGSGRDRLEFRGKESLNKKELKQPFYIIGGEVQNIYATVKPRKVEKLLQFP